MAERTSRVRRISTALADLGLIVIRGGATDAGLARYGCARESFPGEFQSQMLEECGIPEQTIAATLAGGCEWAVGKEDDVRAALREIRAIAGVERELRFLLAELLVGVRLYGYQVEAAQEVGPTRAV